MVMVLCRIQRLNFNFGHMTDPVLNYQKLRYSKQAGWFNSRLDDGTDCGLWIVSERLSGRFRAEFASSDEVECAVDGARIAIRGYGLRLCSSSGFAQAVQVPGSPALSYPGGLASGSEQAG